MDLQKWRPVQLLHCGRGGIAELQSCRLAGSIVLTDEEEVELEDWQPVAANRAYFQTKVPVCVAIATEGN